MKVLVVLGSYRKGNTYDIVRKVEDRMKQKDGMPLEFEYLFLKDVNLKKCVGCQLCVTKGEDKCPLQDDRDMIFQKMLEADGVVFASPIYVYQITGLLKNFIDRFGYMVHRPVFFGKQALIVVVRGAVFKDSLKYMNRVIKSWGFNVSGEIGAFEFDSLTEAFKIKSQKEVDTAADSFYAALNEKRIPLPSLYDMVGFEVWKLNAEVNKKNLVKDYEYWKENKLFDKDYYYNIRINPIKRVLVKLASSMSRTYMKKIFIGY